MTTPTLGHPDWQALPDWQSTNLLPSSVINQPPGSVAGPVIAVSQWAATRIRILPTAGQARILINWWIDKAGTIPAGADTFTVTPQSGLTVVMINEAQFVQLTITNTGGVNFQARAYMAGVNSHGGKIVYPITSNDVSVLAETIPASGFAKHSPGWLMSGPFWLNINPADTSGKLSFNLVYEDETGTAIAKVAGPYTPTADFTLSGWTAPKILSLHVANNDAVNPHTYDAELLIAAI